MAEHPILTHDRLRRWTYSRGISARYEGSQYLHCDIEGFPGLVKLDVEVDLLTVILAFLLPQGSAGLDTETLNPEKNRELIYRKGMANWVPREFYYPASEDELGRYERQIDIPLDEGITEYQLDELIPTTVDALYAAQAFHPSIAEAIAQQSGQAFDTSGSITAAWRQSIGRRALSTYCRSDLGSGSVDELAWWNVDQQSIGTPVNVSRIKTILSRLGSRIKCAHHDGLSVFSIFREGLDIELILGEGKIGVRHYWQLSPEEMRHEELSDYWAETFERRYTRYSLGKQENADGVLLHYQYWQPVVPMTDHQLRAFIDSSIGAIRYQVNEVAAHFNTAKYAEGE